MFFSRCLFVCLFVVPEGVAVEQEGRCRGARLPRRSVHGLTNKQAVLVRGLDRYSSRATTVACYSLMIYCYCCRVLAWSRAGCQSGDPRFPNDFCLFVRRGQGSHNGTDLETSCFCMHALFLVLLPLGEVSFVVGGEPALVSGRKWQGILFWLVKTRVGVLLLYARTVLLCCETCCRQWRGCRDQCAHSTCYAGRDDM